MSEWVDANDLLPGKLKDSESLLLAYFSDGQIRIASRDWLTGTCEFDGKTCHATHWMYVYPPKGGKP